MKTNPNLRARRRPPASPRERGSFLLEALAGIAILSFGILGIVGLQAQSVRWINDAQYRSEAIYHANAVLARMWADNPTQLLDTYDSAKGGAGYLAFKSTLEAPPPYGLPHADEAAYAPEITVLPGPSANSSLVTVAVRWRLPGETKGGYDGLGGSQYVTSAIIGAN